MCRDERPATPLLADIQTFSNVVLKRPLRPYQLAPLQAALDSVRNIRGHEYLLVFPRQSGKNEAVAQLLAYLLNLFQRTGGSMIYGAIGDQLGIGLDRLEEALDNRWNARHWKKKVRPDRRCLVRACVVFVSSHPLAFARGQTANHLLVLDEIQDQNAAHVESVFTPMRAAENATALYIGTVKTTHDTLWQKKAELERETERDGIRRVWMVTPEEVCQEVPAYRQFLNSQVRKHGRNHPIVASEYFLEPMEAAGGLFPPRRLLLMRGHHPRLQVPVSGELYVATLDVAGEDEGATDPVARLEHPARDYTVAHIFRVVWAGAGAYAPGPTYEAVDAFVDHGTKHFQDHPGRPALVHQLAAWLESWQVSHLVADECGVGQGMVSWLAAALGPHRVTGYDFAAYGQKARLGSLFLSLVETGRFKYWGYDPQAGESPPSGAAAIPAESSALPRTDGWWFWRQAEACTYDLPPEGQFERDLRWGVPAGHKTPVSGATTAMEPTHDDRLLSAALVAHLDRLVRNGTLALGRAESVVIKARDPLAGLAF